MLSVWLCSIVTSSDHVSASGSFLVTFPHSAQLTTPFYRLQKTEAVPELTGTQNSNARIIPPHFIIAWSSSERNIDVYCRNAVVLFMYFADNASGIENKGEIKYM
jgi:hypothetical protein